MSDEQKNEDNFVKPKLPFRRPVIDLNDKPDDKQLNNSTNQLDNNQQKHEQTSSQESIKRFPSVLTQLKPSKNVFYLEEIKDGTVIRRQYLNNNIIVLGRATDCDLIFEHCSISRYHAALYWKENKQKLDDYGFFYLTDLNSSHGTFHNKVQLDQNKFLKLTPNKSFIKLGASSRLLLFSCVNEDDELDNEEGKTTNEDEIKTSYLPFKLKNQMVTKERFEKEECCTWGMLTDDDLKSSSSIKVESGLQVVLDIINENTVIDKTDNQDSYIQNPQKIIQNWFEYEGYEFEYLISSDNNKCTINFPIEDQEVPINGEEEIKKKDAINSACLRACKILDKAFLLFSWQKNSRFEKRKHNSDDEQDDLLDETGERESKRKRLEALKNKKVDNLDTLTKRLDELKTEIEGLKVELDEIDRDMNASKAGNQQKIDELDQYMQTVSKNSNLSLNDLKIKKSKGKMKMSQLIREKERTERLIKIAQPSQITFITKNQASNSSISKASELIEKAKAKLNQKKQEESTIVLSDDEAISKKVKVIEVNLDQVNEKSEQPFKTSLKFSKPTAKILSKSKLDLDEEKEQKSQSVLVRLDDDDDDEINQVLIKKKVLSKIDLDEMETDNSELNENNEKIKNNTNRQNRPNQMISRRDEEEEIDDDKYVEWVPPEERETIDSRSHLNEKYGY